MKSAIVIVIGLAFAAAGCDKDKDKVGDEPVAARANADNTKKNERDRHSATLTPGDQGENEVDRGITQKIRQEVVKADGLSMSAKNVKIITVDSVVTLRGPVKSEQERTSIVAIAQSTSGVKRVDNQLEVAAN